MHQLTDTLAARVATAINAPEVQPLYIVEGKDSEPVKLVCPFASTGKRQHDLRMAADIADDYLATQPEWRVVVIVQFADGHTVHRADLRRYNRWVEQR